jgi:beta-lactamase regulating signal transducer with metallopeptidase domain
MSRWFLPVLALLSAATPLVVDTALKGAALMSAALLGALLLSGASAAARHLVWLIGVLALLAVPLLSLVLPGWRVLPAWAVPPSMEASPLPEKDMSNGFHRTTPLSPAAPEGAPLPGAAPERSPDTPATAAIPAALTSVAAVPVVLPQPVLWWRTALPSLWSAGCAVLLLRLLGAHWFLRRAARRARAVSDGPLTAALAAAALRLGVTQRVRLLVEEKRTIPVVWGVWRPRLMLPVEALTWDSGQLQSVLLHELAHIRRRDTLVQWVTQIACAVHWFNPLVWLAAWRLHVERERACDDMVLASGVKASAYAEHLLHIASQLSPARWTSACGLAMARKSALEGRLMAVLSGKLNRRGVTAALAASSLILGAGVAIPVAMLRAAGPDNKADAASAANQTPPPMRNRTGKIQPATQATLKWGEPVNGLRMALAFPPALKDPLLGEEEFYQLVVQNVSEKEIRYIADADAPNPRSMQWREGKRIVQALSDSDAQKADWTLAPGECGVLWMFTKEERNKDGKTISSLLDKDLGGGPRYHVVVNMEVAKAPEGAWAGKLITGETRGSSDKADAPKASDAGPRRKVDWSKPPADSFFEGKYDPELLARLAGNPGTLNDDNNVWPLSEQILRAAVEGDPQFRHLLTDEKLAAADDDSRSLATSLATYDYSVFGNKAALKVILDQLEHGQHEAYLAAFPLGFVDEWDQSVPAVERVFAQRDGAMGEEYHRFWAHREWFFPESYAAFQKKQLESNKLDAASLQGVWKGSKEDVDVTLRFGKGQDWEVRFLETDRKSALFTEPAYTATCLYLMGANEKGTPVHCGTLRRGSDGALLLHVLEHGATREDLGYRRVTDLILTKEADAPKGADAGLRRKVDDVFQLFPESYARHFSKELAAVGIDAASLRGTWKGSKDGINAVLRFGDIKEWEITRAGKTISRAQLITHSSAAQGDGTVTLNTLDETQSDAPYTYSWLKPRGPGKLRLHLYSQEGSTTPTVTEVDLTKQATEPLAPGNPKTAAVKLTPDALLGAWRGTVNGEKLMLSFHRPPAEKDVQCDIYFGEATIGALAGFTIAEDGSSAEVVQHRAGGGVKFGTLIPGEAGKLKLELYGRQKGQQETILTRDAEAAATEPQQEEARALFELWRRQADDVEDGAIPYWLVDGLADEVRAFVHAHPILDSAAKLESLLPRFATSVNQSLPLADAIELLNDVAYYSTKPMEAYLAREQRLEMLIGSWEGKVNGRAASLRIGRRSPVSNGICMELRFPTEGEFETLQYGAALDGIAFKLGLEQADGKPKPFGSLVPVTEESLKLTVLGKEAVFILTRKVELQPTEPREQAARELFEIWKTTANADGTIPGAFIGNLATEVRAFGKAHAGRRHADNIVKLLPRFVTSRDWTQAEGIKLLDDVAYFATDPIVARLTKAKLVSGPLWRTMVEFQDIPVPIEKWSEPLRGLRIGLRIVEADWRIGGKVRAELWLHNAGEKDEIIQTTGPDRQDAGVIVSAIGADGSEHAAHRGSWRILTQPIVCTLPAGSVVMAKTFEVKFFGPENNAAVWSAPEFHGLPAGKYKLRCSWSDAAGLYEGKEWKGSLTAPEVEFTLVAGTAVDHPKVRPSGEWSAAWRELSATVAAARGTPEADEESLIAWGDTKEGLRSGVLMTDRVKRGGRAEARLVVRNVSEKSVTVALSPVPNRIDVEAAAADGTRLQVHKVVLFGTDPFFSHTFKPGEQIEFPAPPILFGVERDADGKVRTPGFPICGVETGPGTVSVRFSMTNVHAPDSGVVKVAVE